MYRGNYLYEGVGFTGASQNRDHQLATRGFLMGITDDVLAISANKKENRRKYMNPECVVATATITPLLVKLEGLTS